MKDVLLLSLVLAGLAGHAQPGKGGYYRRQYELLSDEKKFQEADQYADSAWRAAVGTGDADTIVGASRWLYESYFSKRDFEKALNYFRAGARFADSVSTYRHGIVEEDLRSRMLKDQDEYRRQEAEWQDNLKRLQDTVERDRRSTLIMLGGMFSLCAVIVLIIYRRLNLHRHSGRKLQADLAHLQSFKEKLFVVLSYDLKNGFVALENLTRGSERRLASLSKEESIQLIANLHDTAAELRDTLHNVIQWVGYEAHAKLHQPEVFDSKELAERAMAKFHRQLGHKGLSATVFIPEHQMVFADREMVEIVLENLLSNAIHFTPAGGTITCFSGRKEGLVTIGVKDTGIGLSPESIAKLFDVKEDFHAIGKPSHKGAGVGLILCKDLVERNGGRMYVESSPGQGSTFYFTLREK